MESTLVGTMYGDSMRSISLKTACHPNTCASGHSGTFCLLRRLAAAARARARAAAEAKRHHGVHGADETKKVQITNTVLALGGFLESLQEVEGG